MQEVLILINLIVIVMMALKIERKVVNSTKTVLEKIVK